ncbi:F-box/WD-40 repeat-containing protein [Nymphaea thermarum]|nr:F-box/WD-40 repeat-containing protein [Nymphaea thermarum]
MAASSSSTVNQTEIGGVRTENVPMQVINLRLTKENYFSWSPAMTMGIAAHDRMIYIDGSNPEPAKTSAPDPSEEDCTGHVGGPRANRQALQFTDFLDYREAASPTIVDVPENEEGCNTSNEKEGAPRLFGQVYSRRGTQAEVLRMWSSRSYRCIGEFSVPGVAELVDFDFDESKYLIGARKWNLMRRPSDPFDSYPQFNCLRRQRRQEDDGDGTGNSGGDGTGNGGGAITGDGDGGAVTGDSDGSSRRTGGGKAQSRDGGGGRPAAAETTATAETPAAAESHDHRTNPTRAGSDTM